MSKARAGTCHFPSCGRSFTVSHRGTIPSNCPQHRGKAFQPSKIKDARRKLELRQANERPVEVEAVCQHPPCGKAFTFIREPGENQSYRYCPEHRTRAGRGEAKQRQVATAGPGYATFKERDFSDEEAEFLKAIERFKREKRKPFPTWSEVLAVARSLGYRKVAGPMPLALPADLGVPPPTA